jgi:hypothetical protein
VCTWYCELCQVEVWVAHIPTGFPVIMEKFWAVRPLEHECGMGYVSSIYAANGLIRRCLLR